MRTRPENISPSKFNIAIIGGGFTGATLAAQLLRSAGSPLSIVVVEKSASVGRGLAYGTKSNSLLLNVRARNMSALADDPQHFLRWAQANYDSAIGPGSFLPREVYGRYIEALLNDAMRSNGSGSLQWIKDETIGLSPTGDGAVEIELRSGKRLLADRAVLAVGNFPPANPLAGLDAGRVSQYCRDPWSAGVLVGVENLENILLIGSGLTSVDLAIQLRAHGYRGTIHVLSRRGLFPRWHKALDACPPFWNESSPKNMRGLLRFVREQVRQAEKQGVEWQSVFDSLRPLVGQIWQSLPEQERRRFLRHVRPYWEIHRHRAATEIARIIENELANRTLQLHAGRIMDYKEKNHKVDVTYLARKTGKEDRLLVDRVINCTGPETDCRRLQDPVIDSLLARGLARPDPLFLGLDVSSDGALVDRDGAVSRMLYAAGPLRKGNLWESTAVPEIRQQVSKLVEHLARESRDERSAHHLSKDRLRAENLIATNA
jgi:uncharacterized NAD(P)/FAD-binding protein YdhS